MLFRVDATSPRSLESAITYLTSKLDDLRDADTEDVLADELTDREEELRDLVAQEVADAALEERIRNSFVYSGGTSPAFIAYREAAIRDLAKAIVP